MELKRWDKFAKRDDEHFFRNGKSVIVRKTATKATSTSRDKKVKTSSTDWTTKTKPSVPVYKTKDKPILK